MQSIVYSSSKPFLIPNFKFTALVTLICFSMGVNAQESEQKESEFSIGIGGISSQKAYKDIDRDNFAIPFLNYENKYIHFSGATLDLKLPAFDISNSQQVNFSITGKYDFGGYDDDQIKETPILNGMDERKGGFWAGAKAKWTNDLVDVNAEWITDVSGKSKGQRASLGLERTWQLNDHFLISPRVVARWSDKKDIDYLYGVRPHEVREDRPEYIGKSAINFEYGLRSVYMYNSKHSAFLDVSATSLAKEIKESPLVDSSNENQIIIGYMYRF